MVTVETGRKPGLARAGRPPLMRQAHERNRDEQTTSRHAASGGAPAAPHPACPGDAMNRAEVSRAMAKAIAYKQCGKDREAAQWAAELVRLLQCAEILKGE